MQWTFSESNEDQVVRKDLIALKKEMASISMVDEFSRYAKLQRKYNKLEVEAKEKSTYFFYLIFKFFTLIHM